MVPIEDEPPKFKFPRINLPIVFSVYISVGKYIKKKGMLPVRVRKIIPSSLKK